MFRFIKLRIDEGNAVVRADRDGYSNEAGAWADFGSAREVFFGLGRFDDRSRLVEAIVDPTCPGGNGTRLCAGTVTAVDTADHRARCPECVGGEAVLSLDALAAQLGAPVRRSVLSVRREEIVRLGMVQFLSWRITRELADHVTDPQWRRTVCAELADAPRAGAGLRMAVSALSEDQVLDLFPALQDLGVELPAVLREQFQEAAVSRRSNAGIAALRMGFDGRPRWAA